MGTKRRRRSESAPGWAWMLFGLSIGLAVALVVYLKSGLPPTPPGARVTEAEPPPAQAIPDSEPTGPAPANDSDSERVPTRQESLGFYTDLRELEVVVPEGGFDFDDRSELPGDIVIQAGAFPDLQRADARKAELALLGIEAEIQPATVDGRRFFRVVIGPLGQRERGRTNEILRQLTARGIESFPRLADE